MTQGTKLTLTVLLLAVAIGLVALTAAIHRVGPLFAAWLPLVGAAWVLARHDPGYVPPPPARQPDAPPAAEPDPAEGPVEPSEPPADRAE